MDSLVEDGLDLLFAGPTFKGGLPSGGSRPIFFLIKARLLRRSGLGHCLCCESSSHFGGRTSYDESFDSSSAPSALEERRNELIQENLKDRKGDLGDGQRLSEVRQGVEHDLNVEKKERRELNRRGRIREEAL